MRYDGKPFIFRAVSDVDLSIDILVDIYLMIHHERVGFKSIAYNVFGG